MFSLSGPAAAFTVLVMVVAIGLMLLVSFRDTIRGFREFFEPAVFRGLFRSIRRSRPRLSLRALLIAAAVVPPCIALAFHWYLEEGHSELVAQVFADFGAFAVVGGYLLIIVAPLVYYFYSDAFGPSPRERWRRFSAKRDYFVLDDSGPPQQASSSPGIVSKRQEE